jgi:cysteine desulfurase family protein (TIGR01976 family)
MSKREAETPVVADTPFLAATARRRFAALRAPDAPVFFDNAAGAQVPDEVVAAVRAHLEGRNVQRGGRYDRSRAVDAVILATRRRLAAFLGAGAPEEIVFGLNATSLTRIAADAVRSKLRPGDRVVVTQLDHESNVGPWLRLERFGIEPRWWRLRGDAEARLELEDLEAILREGRVRLVALPLASNVSGRIVDVAAVSRLARVYGAWTYVDAVHYGPHGPLDAQALGVDFLVFSGYKIFGPHVGFLWGRRELLDSLEAVREQFIPATSPYAYEGGTQNFEAIAGLSGMLHYLATADEEAPAAAPAAEVFAAEEAAALRSALTRSMDRIRAHEIGLAAGLVRAVASMPGAAILGDADPERADARVPTVSFTIAGKRPEAIVDHLASRGIHAREGHMYAPELLRAAGFDPDLGVARVSLCHYNDAEEVELLAAALREL